MILAHELFIWLTRGHSNKFLSTITTAVALATLVAIRIPIELLQHNFPAREMVCVAGRQKLRV